jgi:hypothetical protein
MHFSGLMGLPRRTFDFNSIYFTYTSGPFMGIFLAMLGPLIHETIPIEIRANENFIGTWNGELMKNKMKKLVGPQIKEPFSDCIKIGKSRRAWAHNQIAAIFAR